MATTYTKADPGEEKFILGVMKYYHPKLSEAGVTLDILFAANPAGGAVKHNGHRCAAKIKKTSLEDRVAGKSDAVLIIDAERWKRSSSRERTALMDHELTHLQLSFMPRTTIVNRDDIGRPVLRLRKDDWCLTGFGEVVQRHGVNAVEGQMVAVVKRRLEQLSFDWHAAETLAAYHLEGEEPPKPSKDDVDPAEVTDDEMAVV